MRQKHREPLHKMFRFRPRFPRAPQCTISAMFQRTRFIVSIAILMWLVVPAGARACGCSQNSPGACQGMQKGDVVFLGTVTASEDVPLPPVAPPVPTTSEAPNPGAPAENAGAGTSGESSNAAPPSSPVTRYHFHIDDRFGGPEATEIDVFSGGDDGDCGYRFKKGEQYIVFTQQEVEGKLFATLCNGTRPASEGLALLPQLRAMRNGQQVASVFGVLRRADPPFLAPPDDPDDPLPNVSLKLRSRDDRFSTSTGPDGIYTFYHVHAGEYRFTANLPVRMVLTQKTLTGGLPPFKIPDGACYEYNVDALPTGHIRGSVLGPDGKPLKLASVELYRAGQYVDTRPGLWGFQGSKGYFDFDHIGPGEYVVVYNRTGRRDPNSPFPRSFYPGETDASSAQPIVLKDGQQLLKVNIKLSDGYPTRPLRVRVKWEHGQPPGSLTVMAKADDGTANPAAQKSADGVFEFPLLASGHYTVSAWEDLAPQRAAAGRGANCTIPARIDAGSVSVDASDSFIKEITLTFAAVGCSKE
jgi:hypothetical protein